MSKDTEAQRHLESGNTFYWQGKYIEACKEYQKAIEIDPNYVEAYYNWGLALAGLEKYEEAIEKFQKAISLKADYVDAYYFLGLALANLKKYEEAIEKYQKAIEFDPNYVRAYNNWGNALSDLKKYDEAIEKYQKVIEIDLSSVNYDNWNDALDKLTKDVKDKAIEKFHKTILSKPADVGASGLFDK